MRRILPLLALLLALAAPTIGMSAIPGVDDDDSALDDGDDDSGAIDLWTAAGDDDSAPLALLPEVSDEQAGAALQILMSGTTSGWGILAAAVLSLLIFGARKLGLLKKLPKKALPWVAAIVAMLADVLTAVVAGTPIGPALAQGLMLGAGAVGFWELALKHLVDTEALKPEAERKSSQQ